MPPPRVIVPGRENSEDLDIELSTYSDDFEDADGEASENTTRNHSRHKAAAQGSVSTPKCNPVTFAEEERENTSDNVELPWLSPPPSRPYLNSARAWNRDDLASACPSEHVEVFYGDEGGFASRPYSVGSPVRPTSEEGYVNLEALGLQAMPSEPTTPKRAPSGQDTRAYDDETFEEDVYERSPGATGTGFPALETTKSNPQGSLAINAAPERQASLPNIHHTDNVAQWDNAHSLDLDGVAQLQLPPCSSSVTGSPPKDQLLASSYHEARGADAQAVSPTAQVPEASSAGTRQREKLSLSYNSGTSMLQACAPQTIDIPELRAKSGLGGSLMSLPVPRPQAKPPRLGQSVSRATEKLPRGSRPPSSRKNKGIPPAAPDSQRKPAPPLEKAIITD